MPLRTLKDASGVPIQFMEVDGIFYPYNSAINQDETIPATRNIEGRDDDVLLITYAKSGTHWLWEVLSMMHYGKAETIPTIKQDHMFEFTSIERLKSLPSPRIINTHYPYRLLPTDMLKRKTKIILQHRNPKDVAASHYNHNRQMKIYNYEGEWKDWLQFFMAGQVDCGSWFDYVRTWEHVMEEHPDHPIHLMYYEDMKENSEREIEKMAYFLGLKLSKELCKSIADKCQFENMKVDKKGLENEHWLSQWRDNKPNYYRKGIVGDWKNWFTVAQSEQFDQVYQEKMKGSKLKFRFEL